MQAEDLGRILQREGFSNVIFHGSKVRYSVWHPVSAHFAPTLKDLEDALSESVSLSQRITLRSCQIIWRRRDIFIELVDGLLVRALSLR